MRNENTKVMIRILHSGSLDLYILAYRSTLATSNINWPLCPPPSFISIQRTFSSQGKRESRVGELECHGNSPCLQELPFSLDSILGDRLQVRKSITLEGMNDSKLTEEPKQRESLNRYLQILFDLFLASSDPCTKALMWPGQDPKQGSASPGMGFSW